MSACFRALRWLQMLCNRLNTSFIVGVVIVYGLTEGFGESFLRVAADYYWKDVQGIQPSALQLYVGLCYIPSLMKPLWGVLTDSFPLFGYHRRPYFLLAGIMGIFPAIMLSSNDRLAELLAVACLISVHAGIAIAGVTIDACIARNSIRHPPLARDMQTLCMICNSVGALLGYSSSGFVIHQLGAQGALGLMSIPPIPLLLLAFIFYEPREPRQQINRALVLERVAEAIRNAQVWKPSLYIYLSMALSISTHEGQFYWYTDPLVGPAFTQEFVGMIYAIGAIGSIIGVLIYHQFLGDWTFRDILVFAQLLFGVSGMLDLMLVLRWNLWVAIPDYVFVAIEESCSRIVFKLSLTAINVLCMRLSPPGIEGTFAALLKCIQSLGSLSSKWGGSIGLSVFHVTRKDLSNLSLILLVRNLLRFATLGLVFLVPNAGQADNLVNADDNEEGLHMIDRIED